MSIHWKKPKYILAMFLAVYVGVIYLEAHPPKGVPLTRRATRFQAGSDMKDTLPITRKFF